MCTWYEMIGGGLDGTTHDPHSAHQRCVHPQSGTAEACSRFGARRTLVLAVLGLGVLDMRILGRMRRDALEHRQQRHRRDDTRHDNEPHVISAHRERERERASKQ